MPDPAPAPRLTIGELARRALAAAGRRERTRYVERLARATRTPEHVGAVADLLLAAGPPGPAVFLLWVGELSGPIPPTVLDRARTLIADRKLPVSARVAGAAGLLHASLDR